MSTTNPPDGWSVGVGTVWGTEVDREEPATLLPPTGLYSIKFLSGQIAELYSDTKLIEGDRPYRCDLVIRSDRANAGDEFKAIAIGTDEDDAFTSGIEVHGTFLGAGAVVSPINTWNRITAVGLLDSATRKVQLFLSKPGADAMNFWVDRFTIQRAPFAFGGARTASAQTFTASAFTTLTFNVEDHDHGDCFVHTTGIFTAKEAGWYYFAAGAELSLTDTKRSVCTFFVNGTEYKAGSLHSSGVTANHSSHVSLPIYCAVGDTVTARLWHNNTSDTSQVVGLEYNYFRGVQLPPFGFG